ncbi:MAG: InlB B-repeat-containing protein, partial [Treponema sp.]|nr:InlB B-repeat-containing protein [Treponema sp.]
MKRLIKRPGIIALMALMVIMAACEYGMVEKPSPYYHSGQPISGEPDGTYTVTFDKNGGDTEASPGTMSVISPATTVDALPTPPARTDYFFDGWNTAANGSGTEFTASTSVTKSITVYAQWTNTPNSNANIRAVSGDGANALYGLYVGGMPGISNGTPQADAEGFTDITITLSGNNPTADPSRSVVVIVEDKKVSKVEFGINSGNAETTLNDNSAPSTWHVLAKNDEYTTPDTVGKRWTGPLTVAAPTSSSVRGVYVRITAQDGTVQVYRYVQYISVTVTNKVTRGELSALSIGGVDVIKGGDLQGSNSKGIASGWWNRTVAPDFEPGLVTIPSAQAASCAVSATVNNSASGVNISIAKISASEWPLLESSSVTFGAASSNTTGTGTFNVQNGDYIVIRQNASPSDANYKALFSHTIIKVNFEVPTVTFNKNGGDTEASPATKPVTPPATTVGTLPTPPTRTGYSFTGWDTVAGGSGSAFTATTTVTESATVYAQWSAYTLSISYANGGGTGSAPASPASAAYGTNVTMPANTYTNEA